MLTEQDLSNRGFRSLGKNVQISDRASLYGIENISIGNNVRIDDFVVIIATGNVQICSFVSIHNFCFLGGKYNIFLKDFVTLAPGVKIFSASDDYSGEKLTGITVPSDFTGGKKGEVILEKHVIVGSGSIILPKLRIGIGCSIGALSLVKDNLDPWGVYGGVPVKRLKDREKKLLKYEEKLIMEFSK
ncbi:MAG: acyltransferase [Parachlamydiales bacterium]|jgi:galactoside O-acetyltransferase